MYAIVFIILFLLSACNNSSMRGIDDGLTVIGVILAIMIGAYYFIKKIWMTTKKGDNEN
jgi:hypothetical protein